MLKNTILRSSNIVFVRVAGEDTEESRFLRQGHLIKVRFKVRESHNILVF